LLQTHTVQTQRPSTRGYRPNGHRNTTAPT
jgi:hypothetical protein